MSDVPREQVMGSDAELIAAVRAGDNAAFGDLFGRHRMAAVRLANQLMPGPDADDLVSEAFVKVLGPKITDQQMAKLPLSRHDFHPDWNYTLKTE